MISDWPTSQAFSTSAEWSAFLSTLCFHVLCLSWCIFFCHRAILSHLIPWLYALQIPRVSKSHLLSEEVIPGAETRILFSSFLQPLRILITIVSFWVLTYPLMLRVGFLRVWIVALLVPGWCPSHLAFDCETKGISALTKVLFRPECLHILPVDCPPSPGIREDCHCPHFPDEESRLSESVSLVAEPQRQKE